MLSILRRGGTVFTLKDILLASGETKSALLKRRINYYIKQGELYPIRKGIYARDRNYDRLELANKIYTPSYISFETVLSREGVIFQEDDRIFAASYLSREITGDGRLYVYRRLKESVLLNPLGIERRADYSLASKERAFMDTIYLSKDRYFDNLSSMNWDVCYDMLPIYGNKALAKRLRSYQKQARNA